MTATATAPATTAEEPASAAPAPTPPGLAGVVGSSDHKVAGRLWVIASLVHLVLVGAAAVAIAVEKLDVSSLDDLISSDWVAQVFTYRSIGGVFLFLLPITIGVATVVVPLQVGAATIAFPRAASAAAWTYLVGGGLVVGAFAIGGGPFGTDADGVELFIVAFTLVLVAQVLAWICVGTTVVALRAPGMHLTRVPLFAWSSLVAAGVWVLLLPALAAVMVLSYVDIRYGTAAGIFGGGAATLYDRIAWVFTQPAVYAFAVPALGMVASVIPVFTDTRHRLHRVAMGCIGAFGALSLGAWIMPAFGTDAAPWRYDAPWVGVSLLVVLPVAGLVVLWLLTLRAGRPRLESPLIFGGAAALMLLAGVLAGAVAAVEPVKTLVDEAATSLLGTSWTTGVASYVVLATAIAMLGGVVYWAPKVVGRCFDEVPTRLVALLLLAGTVLWSLAELLAGLFGQPANILSGAVSENEGTIELFNAISLIGGVLLAVGAAGFVALFAKAAASRTLPGDDPWSGHTLEWATASPPPVGNFASVPAISSEAPLYDARHGQQEASD